MPELVDIETDLPVIPSLPTPTLVRVLYVFAGEERQADVGSFLRKMEADRIITLQLDEVDLLRGHDTLQGNLWPQFRQKILDDDYDVVLSTPPCHTHSRARHSNRKGPPPVRSKAFPLGFPWLYGAHLNSVTKANLLIDQMHEACEAAFSVGAAYFTEHPEDLGKIAGKVDVPASIFAEQRMFDMVNRTGGKTGVFHQCPMGASSPKPTRVATLLDIDNPEDGVKVFMGWPRFNASGFYQGPLPRWCGHEFHEELIGFEPDGRFNTAKSASYPPAMCRWIANMIVRWCKKIVRISPEGGVAVTDLQGEVFPPLPPGVQRLPVRLPQPPVRLPVLQPPVPLQEAVEEEHSTSEEDEPGVAKPRLQNFLPGVGPPLSCTWGGKSREFHDGCGLCSPGRWLPKDRKLCVWPGASKLRDAWLKLLYDKLGEPSRIVLKLACKQYEISPFDDNLIAEGRKLWFDELARYSEMPRDQLEEVSEDQPFYLFAVGETLRLMGDPDWRVFYESKRENFVDGVSVGPGTRMPRTPCVFERRRKAKKYDETEMVVDMDNYKSASGANMEKVLEEQFAAEEKLGMMFKTKTSVAKQQFPNLRVAAQGAIRKEDDSFRILHDATHGVRINNDTIIRDQIRMPGAAEGKTLMCISAAEDEGPHFALQADVKKAHRRYKHRRDQWGLLACRSNSNMEELWINKVGTFGFACASYWWGRLVAGLGRLNLNFFMTSWIFQLIYADDLRTQACGQWKYRELLLSLFIWVLTGTPFSWPKCKGGLAVEWVGYLLDYSRFEVGVSEARGNWLLRWGSKILLDGMVQVGCLSEGLGRLGFCAGVLEWCKPFLAPMYSWVAAAPPGAVLAVPAMVRLSLTFLMGQLKKGRRMTGCRFPSSDLGLLFKTDAKGEETYVVLGGWECKNNTPIGQARWFSVKLTAAEAPWLFLKGHGSKTIASSELLATLLAVHLFCPCPSPEAKPTKGLMVCGGETDNAGNMYVVGKLMTTKLPLVAVLMELAIMLADRNLWLDLQWVRRTSNIEADALTNEEFEGFDPSLRIEVDWGKLPRGIMDEMLAVGEKFALDLETLKLKKREHAASHGKKGKVRKVKGKWE